MDILFEHGRASFVSQQARRRTRKAKCMLNFEIETHADHVININIAEVFPYKHTHTHTERFSYMLLVLDMHLLFSAPLMTTITSTKINI